MTRPNEFRNDSGADKAGGSCDKDSHDFLSFPARYVARVYADDLDEPSLSCYKRR